MPLLQWWTGVSARAELVNEKRPRREAANAALRTDAILIRAALRDGGELQR
jgi:hypothetical protein